MTEQGDSAAAFAKIGVIAGPELASQIRQELAHWLQQYFLLDAEKSSDVLLAVYEALANAAEFAYDGADQPGPMHVRAAHDPDTSVLTVTVSDEGRWRVKDQNVHNPARGRGIPLMHALTDRTEIDSTPAGTEVRLHWDDIAQNCGSRTT
ncbi:ATP-binding protein [Mycolicibacterium diernhoferi]|uniref:ATP-binding protein n=1 Tax=Mycolicibacterium diernhoferi TaxID=1801 RepID=A0A1Q4H4K2_9MYCO|nr:ATP-binding protein [Mycolicibacterium diernhoferi]OJZ62480.1 anti-sigma regulatory factor [Mycolicibacterium diernhoferi]OPE50030.1 anti-sigma regulatory factor [Mycolicibacterium diernhoferi]PEG52208.1 ATP-binding protein [Mycolicibacterium diernhoferi]QYL22008.1 ATP-binding protein [Mycolicibacterium diernhoferi]